MRMRLNYDESCCYNQLGLAVLNKNVSGLRLKSEVSE